MFAEALERKYLEVTPHTLVDKYQQSIQWHHITEDHNLHTHNLESQKLFVLSGTHLKL